MADTDALLAANTAFYTAFNAHDLEVMASLWSEGDATSCIHPGWPALFGREAVLNSWRDIFAAGTTLTVTCHHPRAWVSSDGGLVVCYEATGDQLLAATNLFRREAGVLRLHHHQAGPCAEPPPAGLGTTLQ